MYFMQNPLSRENVLLQSSGFTEGGISALLQKLVRSGIRTHAYRSRLRPERSALDRSAILTPQSLELSVKIFYKIYIRFGNDI